MELRARAGVGTGRCGCGALSTVMFALAPCILGKFSSKTTNIIVSFCCASRIDQLEHHPSSTLYKIELSQSSRPTEIQRRPDLTTCLRYRTLIPRSFYRGVWFKLPRSQGSQHHYGRQHQKQKQKPTELNTPHSPMAGEKPSRASTAALPRQATAKTSRPRGQLQGQISLDATVCGKSSGDEGPAGAG